MTNLHYETNAHFDRGKKGKIERGDLDDCLIASRYIYACRPFLMIVYSRMSAYPYSFKGHLEESIMKLTFLK